jgi:uncharacterized membrane protein YhaH (DUF805 family)
MRNPLLIINVVVAISAGLITLIGYFIPGLEFLSDVLLRWAVILAGFALILGVVNLLSVHARRLRKRKAGSLYSLLVILSFLITLILVAVTTPTGSAAKWIFQNIQLPVEASLMAILVAPWPTAACACRRSGLLPVISC